jgi:hypothetical protein
MLISGNSEQRDEEIPDRFGLRRNFVPKITSVERVRREDA